MSLTLVIEPAAEADVQAIFDYIAQRSPDGAYRWYEAFLSSASRTADFPQSYPLAPENDAFDKYQIRHFLFSTRRGNVYRGVFTVLDSKLRVLRVRGPGQRPLQSSDFDLT